MNDQGIPPGLGPSNSPWFGPWWGCLAGCHGVPGDGAPGSFVGSVAGAVHEELVAVVDQSVEQGLGDDEVGEQRVPVDRAAVAGQNQRLSGPVVDQFVDVVGVGWGKLAHGEVVEHKHG